MTYITPTGAQSGGLRQKNWAEMLYGGKKLLGSDAEEPQKLKGLFPRLDIVPNRDTDVFERFFLIRA